VIVVDALRDAGFDRLELFAANRKPIQPAFTVDEKEPPPPVGSLELPVFTVDRVDSAGRNVDRQEKAACAAVL
jgi:hypothetical protein